MKIFSLFFSICFSLFAALAQEDLKKTFLTDADIGPMSYEKLVEFEDAFRDINRADVFEKLYEKLDRDQISFLSTIVHVCKLEGDTLGTYTRGQSRTSMQTMRPEDDINDLRIFWGRGDLLDVVNKAYKYYVENNGVYASLVVMEWPVICIRPGKMLANNMATFAHEVEHFLGDTEESIDITQYKNEADFVTQYYYQAGGEFDAYSAGALLYKSLEREIGYLTPQSFMKFFDEEGIILDPDGLEKFVLDELEYRQNFVSTYRSLVVNSINEITSEINTLNQWFDLYEENLEISLYNEGIYLRNIGVYQRNKSIYQNRGNLAKVEEMQRKIDQANIDLAKTKAAITFYENIVQLKTSTLDDAQKELSFVQDLFMKLRSGATTHQNYAFPESLNQ